MNKQTNFNKIYLMNELEIKNIFTVIDDNFLYIKNIWHNGRLFYSKIPSNFSSGTLQKLPDRFMFKFLKKLYKFEYIHPQVIIYADEGILFKSINDEFSPEEFISKGLVLASFPLLSEKESRPDFFKSLLGQYPNLYTILSVESAQEIFKYFDNSINFTLKEHKISQILDGFFKKALDESCLERYSLFYRNCPYYLIEAIDEGLYPSFSRLKCFFLKPFHRIPSLIDYHFRLRNLI